MGWKTRTRGLTLLEVVVSISILAIAALAIIATLTRVMLAQSGSSYHTVARLLADTRLQEALLAGPTQWVGSGPNGGRVTEVPAIVGQNSHPTIFYVEITGHTLPHTNDEGGHLFIETGPDMGSLHEVTAKAWWNADETGPQSGTERGTQTLSVSKMVYLEN